MSDGVVAGAASPSAASDDADKVHAAQVALAAVCAAETASLLRQVETHDAEIHQLEAEVARARADVDRERAR